MSNRARGYADWAWCCCVGRSKSLRGKGGSQEQTPGEIAQRDGFEKNDQQRRDTEERSERELILAGDGPAEIADGAEIAAACTLCERELPARCVKGKDDGATDDAAEQRAEENREKCAAQAEKRADHGHHFHVAHPHAFAPAPQFVERGDAPEQKAAERGSQQTVDQADEVRRWNPVEQLDAGEVDKLCVGWWHERGEKESEDEARPIHKIGQESYAKIGDGQDDDDTGERDPLNGSVADDVFEIAHDKQAAGREFDQRVHGRDRKTAGAASTPQPEPAEDGDVVVGLDRGLAPGAART